MGGRKPNLRDLPEIPLTFKVANYEALKALECDVQLVETIWFLPTDDLYEEIIEELEARGIRRIEHKQLTNLGLSLRYWQRGFAPQNSGPAAPNIIKVELDPEWCRQDADAAIDAGFEVAWTIWLREWSPTEEKDG